MNLAAFYATHKVQVLGGGAAGAAGLALILKRRRASAAAAASSSATPTADITSSAGQAYTGGGYDSTASDIYNSLQGQLQSQFSQWAAGQQSAGAGAPSIGSTTPAAPPIPVPPSTQPVYHAPTPPASPRPPAPAPKPIVHTPAPAPRPVATPSTSTHTVSSGENLSVIAARYGLSWQQLYAANRAAVGSNPNLIHPGLRLTIPKR